MKKIIFLLIFSNLLFSKTYVYTGHYPVTSEPYYFGDANAMDIGPDGNLYIASAENRISVFTKEGVFLKAYYLFDEEKLGDKEINILSMAIDPSGNIYVLDSLNGLYKFDKNGKKIKLFYYFWGDGELETDRWGNLYFGINWKVRKDYRKKEPGIIKFDPEGNVLKEFYTDNLAVYDLNVLADGKIYVLFYSKISIYDPDFNLLKTKTIDEYPLPGSEKGFSFMDISNNIFISSHYWLEGHKSTIIKINLNLDFISLLGEYSSFFGDIKTLSEKIFIFNNYSISYTIGVTILSIFTVDGQFVKNWTVMGNEAGKFWLPTKIAVDNPGNIYVADTGNNRIQVFNKKWELQMVIGSEGEGPGQFKKPNAVAVDDEQNIYVADSGNYRIQKFNKRGEFLLMWGSKGVGDGQFETLLDIEVDKDGYVYTLDIHSFWYLQKFTSSGQYILKVDLSSTSCGWGHPNGFGIDTQGAIYVVDHEFWINRYDSSGNLMGCQSKSDVLSGPIDIEISAPGNIFISDSNGLAYFDKNLNFIEYIGNAQDIIKGFPGGGGGIAVHPSGKIYVCSGGDGRIISYEPRPGLALSIPASASTIGANGTYWRTDLSIFNPSDEEMNITLNYFNSFENKSIDLNLKSKEFLSLKDVISNTFGMPETFGAITSICLEEAQPILFSRTYTEQQSSRAEEQRFDVKGEGWSVKGEKFGDEIASPLARNDPQPSLRGIEGAEAIFNSQGTYGQGIRASPYEDTFYQGEKAYLIGLKNNQNFRTNIGFFNLKKFPVEINLKLYDEEGEEIASDEYNLDSFGHLQINNIFLNLNITKDYNGAYGVIWTDTQNGRFVTYSSIVDNYTGDPVYIEGEGYGSYLPEEFIEIIPVVASKEGAYGTEWKTEVVLTNVGVEEQEIELTYHPSIVKSEERSVKSENVAGTEFIQPETLDITLQPGEVRYFKDILTEFFNFPESFGWLEIKHTSSGLKARARIYTEQPLVVKSEGWSVKDEKTAGAEFIQPFVGAGLRSMKSPSIPLLQRGTGSYGQEVKALNISNFSKNDGYLIDLEENENFRTNFGILVLEQQSSRAEEQKFGATGEKWSVRGEKVVKFKLDLIKDGQILDEKEMELSEGSLVQINNTLSSIFNKTGSGYVLKIIPEESTIYTSYISKVDNITGDAIFQNISK